MAPPTLVRARRAAAVISKEPALVPAWPRPGPFRERKRTRKRATARLRTLFASFHSGAELRNAVNRPKLRSLLALPDRSARPRARLAPVRAVRTRPQHAQWRRGGPCDTAAVIRALAGFWLVLVWLGASGCEERRADRCKLECKEHGRCTERGGRCVATSADDCRRSSACEKQGRCAHVAEECRATAEICGARPDCAARGICGEKDGQCAAITAAHCKPTEGCRVEGRCSAVEGTCIAQQEDCANSEACRRFSRCSANAGTCGTFGASDCERGELCRDQGYCTFVKDHCALTSREDCERTDGCKKLGMCSFVADTGKSRSSKTPGCVIGSDADCRKSLVCKEQKFCRKGERACRR